METLKIIFDLFVVLGLMLGAAAVAGLTARIFTGSRAAELINVKPFNCRPCATFWLTLLGCASVAYNTKFFGFVLETRLTLFVVAFLVSLVNFFIVKQLYKITNE